jgi:hypothetical protein
LFTFAEEREEDVTDIAAAQADRQPQRTGLGDMTVDPVVRGQPGQFWTVALRRQPVRIVGGEPEGGYTDAYELICCDSVTTPTWTTSMSRRRSSRSAAPTRCPPE